MNNDSENSDPCPTRVTSDDKKIENAPYYFGLLPKDLAENQLSNVGDFLVRAAQRDKKIDMLITYKTSCGPIEKVITTALKVRASKGWAIRLGPSEKTRNSKYFDTVRELIEYYKYNPMPDGSQLLNPINKPDWFIHHVDISYDVKNSLGSGNFADVYKGVVKGLPVAIKVSHAVSPDEVYSGNLENLEDRKQEMLVKEKKAREDMIREGFIMADCKHRHVIEFVGVALNRPPVMIAMEFCEGGTLVGHLEKQGDKISVGERVQYLAQCAEGMEYLHRKNIIHKDLAARNCLFNRYGMLKITDFGLSGFEQDLFGACNENAKLPIRWMAPEMVHKKPEVTKKCDVWSFGVVAYEVFNNGRKPWADQSVAYVMALLKKGHHPEMIESAPKEMQRLWQQVWQADVNKRIDFTDITRIMSGIQISYPCPLPQDMTLSQIPGMTVLTRDEWEVIMEEQAPNRNAVAKQKDMPSIQGKPSVRPRMSQERMTKINTSVMYATHANALVSKKKTTLSKSDKEKKPLAPKPSASRTNLVSKHSNTDANKVKSVERKERQPPSGDKKTKSVERRGTRRQSSAHMSFQKDV